MLAYVTLGANDLSVSGRFYDAALAPLGVVRLWESANEIGYGMSGGKAFLFATLPFDGQAASFGNGTDVAFDAPSRAAVDAFYRAALANGGSDEGPPGVRARYQPDFYTAYVRDPVGNKLNAVYDRPA